MHLLEGIEDHTPSLMPMNTDFETALINIKTPLKAISSVALEISDPDDHGLCVVGCAISDFLKQLDFLIYNSYLDGKSILGANFKPPFKIQTTGQESHNELPEKGKSYE